MSEARCSRNTARQSEPDHHGMNSDSVMPKPVLPYLPLPLIFFKSSFHCENKCVPVKRKRSERRGLNVTTGIPERAASRADVRVKRASEEKRSQKPEIRKACSLKRKKHSAMASGMSLPCSAATDLNANLMRAMSQGKMSASMARLYPPLRMARKT